jgi:tetratricopeptide (TPR) repeat protein
VFGISKALALAGILALPALARAAAAEIELRAARAFQALRDRDFEGAAVLFADLETSAPTEKLRLDSELALAESCFKRGLYNSALRQYSYMLKAGPSHPHYLEAVEGIVSISEALHEDFITGSILDREYNDEFARLPEAVLSKVNYIVGVVSYRKDKREDAAAFLSAVPRDSSSFARARYLAGVVFARLPQNEKALEAFEDVLRLSDGHSYADLASLKPLAQLGVARTYYAMGRYAEAVRAYDAVPRFGEHWDASLLEIGWARFQNDDPGGALGALQALHAPQFAGSFQPESWILKATIYYERCLYDDAKAALAGFEQAYLPVAEKLVALLEGEKGNDFYYDLMAGGSRELPRAVKTSLRANRRLAGLLSSLDALDREKRVLEQSQALRGTKLSAELLSALGESRKVAVQLAGSFVRKRLDDAAQTLSAFDRQRVALRFEIAKAEAALYEARRDSSAFLREQALDRPAMPSPAWEYWQFQGEFWLDEIGYYRYTLKSGCLDRGPNEQGEAARPGEGRAGEVR